MTQWACRTYWRYPSPWFSLLRLRPPTWASSFGQLVTRKSAVKAVVFSCFCSGYLVLLPRWFGSLCGHPLPLSSVPTTTTRTPKMLWLRHHVWISLGNGIRQSPSMKVPLIAGPNTKTTPSSAKNALKQSCHLIRYEEMSSLIRRLSEKWVEKHNPSPI